MRGCRGAAKTVKIVVEMQHNADNFSLEGHNA